MPKRQIASFQSNEYDLLIAVIEEARETAGIRHDDLAKLLGRGRMFVYSIEHFTRRVDPEEVRQIAIALGLEPGALFDRWLARIANGQRQHGPP